MTQGPRTYIPVMPIWCAGCGHYGVQGALDAAIRRMEIPRHEVMILAGIGCSGTIQNNLGTYGYHALHGRVVPTATGVALANPDLTVVAAGGDGDGYAIGAGHLVHAFRRDTPFTYIVMNNETYGLTKGQHSPTRGANYASHVEAPIDAISLGLSIGATSFIARGYSGSFDQLVHLTVAALTHAREGRGFAFLEVISPCVTYQDTYPRWEQALYDLDTDPDYDPTDRAAAFAVGARLLAEGRLPAGLIYQSPTVVDAKDRKRSMGIDLDLHRRRYREIMSRYAVPVDGQD